MQKSFFTFGEWMANLFNGEYLWLTILALVLVVIIIVLLAILLWPKPKLLGLYHHEDGSKVIVEKKLVWLVDTFGSALKYKLNGKKEITVGQNIFVGNEVKVIEVLTQDNENFQKKQSVDMEYLVIDLKKEKKLIVDNKEYIK